MVNKKEQKKKYSVPQMKPVKVKQQVKLLQISCIDKKGYCKEVG